MPRQAKKIEPPSKRRFKIDPWVVTLGRVLFILNALFWFGYGIYVYYDMAVKNDNTSAADILTLFVFVNAGLLLFSGIKLAAPQRWVYFLALVVALFNGILSMLNIADLFFLFSFLFDLFILWTLVSLFRRYFPKP